MITFAVPWLFWSAVAASLVVVGWHLLSVRQPPDMLFPTARFVPPTTARAVARQPRPSDLVLLALRVIALLCIGLALSGARCYSDRATHAHLILVDSALPDSVVASDSTRWFGSVGDTSAQWRRVPGISVDPGVAIVRAFREVPRLLHDLPRVQTVDVTVVGGARVAEQRVWRAWRSRWPGHIALTAASGVRGGDTTHARADIASEFVGATRDDPVVAGMRVAYPTQTGRANNAVVVRVDRRDSAMTEDVGSVVVRWPASGVPSGWQRLGAVDTIGAISALGQTLVGPFVRVSFAPARSDSASASWRTVAWWNDGAPAAIARQRNDGTGTCEVQVSVVVPPGSDLLLSPHARGLLDALVYACDAPALAMASLAGADANGERPADVRALRAMASTTVVSVPSVWTLVLLAVAAGALMLEWRLRA